MAAPVVPSLIVNEFLNKHNYEEWSVRVQTYLVAKGLWSNVVEDATEPPLKGKFKRETWEKTNAEALHAIHLCCGSDAFKVIMHEERADKAWEALRDYDFSGDTTDTESTKELEEKEDVDETENEVEKEASDEGDIDHQSDHDAEPEKVEEADEPEEVEEGDGDENSGSDNTSVLDEVEYKELFRAAKHSRWETVMDIIRQHPEAAVKATAPTDEEKTVLHYAVEDMRVDIVEQLLQFIKDEDDLDRWDSECYSALEYCYMLPDKDEMVQIANFLVQKKKELADEGGLDYRSVLMEAFMKGRPKLAEYLLNVTEFGTDDTHAAQLISLSFSTKRFNIACKLIQQTPSLAIVEDYSGNSPLNELACTPSAFLSGSRLKFWEKWIYHVIPIKSSVKRKEGLTLTMDNKGKPTPKPHAVSGDVHPLVEGSKGKPTHPPHTIVDLPAYQVEKDKKNPSGYFQNFGWIWDVPAMFQGSVMEYIYKNIFGISHIYKMKVSHDRSHDILVCMCQVLTPEKKKELWEDNEKTEFVKAAMFQAAERGLVEFLIEILKVNPKLAEIENKKGQNLFQVAVEYRQAEVFNLIYGFNQDNRKAYMSMTDNDDNNMLHMMGISSPSSQTNRIRGAALQMQNELKWFKELERMARPEDLEAENDTLDMTPREFFSRNHTEMVKEGEKSMKDTATSCTVVGALMVTMMFAVAFTLPAPQENKDNITLLSRRAFKVFIIADGISLFTSTTSVVLFLGILTSRYAEDDFLKSLPQKMILGLLTLFLSVAAMVIVFASALFIILPSHTFIALPTTLVAGIPIATFIWMQFPFLVEIFYSTYIRSLFDKKKVPPVKLNVGKVR